MPIEVHERPKGKTNGCVRQFIWQAACPQNIILATFALKRGSSGRAAAG